MGKISCKGRMCRDEETGQVFFLPDPSCSESDMSKIKLGAVETGVGFAKPIKQVETKSKK
jgi:hypothetical protein